jgi:hypothetical protein
LFAVLDANQVYLGARSALDETRMDTTVILSAVFCAGLLFGYGLRALISQIRRQKVHRIRQSRSFMEKRHSSPRLFREEEQANPPISGLAIPNLPLLGPHCTLAAN